MTKSKNYKFPDEVEGETTDPFGYPEIRKFKKVSENKRNVRYKCGVWD